MAGQKATSPKDRRRRTGPRPELRGPRPQVWVTGPDPRRHEQYHAWLLHKAQANYRKEGYALPFEDFERAWNKGGAWEHRGRLIDDLCMVRLDPDLPWHKSNISIIPRREQLKGHNEKKIGMRYKQRSDAGKKKGSL